jgi:hypothetical protein
MATRKTSKLPLFATTIPAVDINHFNRFTTNLKCTTSWQ